MKLENSIQASNRARSPFSQLWICPMITLLATLSMVISARADAPAKHRNQMKFEVRFMTEMIDHHAMAIEMGTLCAEKAVHPELQELCEEMVAMQSAEIEQMQMWLRDWYGVEHEPEMTAEDERQLEHLGSLSGGNFEKEFLRMMIEHHSIAVIRAAKCVRKAAHRELTNLCDEMKDAQMTEIHTMQTWLCHWYRICPREGGHRKPRH